MVTRNGIIKRTELDAYKNVRKNGVIAINLDDDDELAWVWLTDGNDDIVVATKNGMSIRFNEKDCRPIGRTARGVRAIMLGDDDTVVGMCVVPENATDDRKILTISETGLGRLSVSDEYRVQNRGGKGVTNYKTKLYGDVAAISYVNEDDDLILISSDGIIIRISASQINVVSRTSKGVRVMRVSEGEKVVSAIAIASDNSDENSQEDETEKNTDTVQETPNDEEKTNQ